MGVDPLRDVLVEVGPDTLLEPELCSPDRLRLQVVTPCPRPMVVLVEPGQRRGGEDGLDPRRVNVGRMFFLTHWALHGVLAAGRDRLPLISGREMFMTDPAEPSGEADRAVTPHGLRPVVGGTIPQHHVVHPRAAVHSPACHLNCQ